MNQHDPHDDDPDESRGRRFENAILLIGFALLVGAGIWLLSTMADVRRAQDCAGQGRRNCETLELPERDR